MPGEVQPLIALLLIGAAGFFSRGAWSRWLGIGWTLFLAAIHAPIYARLSEMENKLTGKMDWQYKSVKDDIKALRNNGDGFSDRMNAFDSRINQAAREI